MCRAISPLDTVMDLYFGYWSVFYDFIILAIILAVPD